MPSPSYDELVRQLSDELKRAHERGMFKLLTAPLPIHVDGGYIEWDTDLTFPSLALERNTHYPERTYTMNQKDNGLRLYVKQSTYLDHRDELRRLMRRVDMVVRCEANYVTRSFDMDVCVDPEVRVPFNGLGMNWPEAHVEEDRTGRRFRLVVRLRNGGDVLWTSEEVQ